MAADHNAFETLIWQIADLLRRPYRSPLYERAVRPTILLRRFNCALATKQISASALGALATEPAISLSSILWLSDGWKSASPGAHMTKPDDSRAPAGKGSNT